MIKYRPHRGSLDESMIKMQSFNSIEEMFNAIEKEWNGWVTFADLSITEDMGNDTRVNWKETRYVCTKRINNDEFNTPQCIGICSIED